MKIQFRNEVFPSVLIFLIFAQNFFGYLKGIYLSKITFVTIVFGFLFLFFKKKIRLNVLFIILILVIQMSLSVLILNTEKITTIIKGVQYMLIAVLLTNFRQNLQIFLFSFCASFCFFGYHIIIGTNPNYIFTVSRNMVSIIMLIQTSLLYLALEENNRRVTLIPALINLYICLWAVGRSGIVSSIILLFGVFYTILKKDENRKKTIGVLILGAIIVLTIYTLQPTINTPNLLLKNIIVARDNFLKAGVASVGRSTILSEYVKVAIQNPRYFIFGVPDVSSEIFSDYGYNYHNSYLQLHSNFGLFGLLLIFSTIFMAIKNLIKAESILELSILLTFLVRISTDIMAFVSIADPILFYFILSWALKPDPITEKFKTYSEL